MWVDLEEVLVVFVVVKDGVMVLVYLDWVDGMLYDIDYGGIMLDEVWDFFMVKILFMLYFEICWVWLIIGSGGGVEILVGSCIVYWFKGVVE